MEPKDIIGKEFTCFEFKTDDTLAYTDFYETIVGKTAVVMNINSSFPQYANAKINIAIGKQEQCHFPTQMIIDQLEQAEFDNKSIDELLNNMKQLISRI